MALYGKEALKELFGEIPLTAELYWLLRQRGKPISRFSLKHLHDELASLVAEVEPFAKSAPKGKRVFVFATLHYWIEHAAMLSLALAGQGHQVTMGYLPYGDWQYASNRFDLRRQNIYAKGVLSKANPLFQALSLLEMRPSSVVLPDAVQKAVEHVSAFDTQYTLQVEDVDRNDAVYRLRLERNQAIARAAYQWLKANQPDVVIVPNGTILELGMVYQVARHLRIPIVTYEFGDQRERIWLAKNDEVMRQNTDALWGIRSGAPLAEEQLNRLQALFNARQRGALWENFARRWQGSPAQGGQQIRESLHLDSRPIVLLATNVLGDSLTLGRQVFSQSMAEWISRTVQYFDGCTDAQLIIRVHPGETLTHGPSMVDVVHQVFPRLPAHIRLIGPKDKVNTYDLVSIADLGLVYTTTVGMEMAMSGVPVIVAGQTHYRGRGFTTDPDSWVNYYKQLGQMITNPQARTMTQAQVESAWNYAYRFFFEYPLPFPWHVVRLWDDVKARPVKMVLGEEGRSKYADTFRYLIGENRNWEKVYSN